MKILKKLFREEDAELVMKLTRHPEELSAIAERTEISPQELEKKLDDLAARGLIHRERSGDRKKYMALHFVVGVYEAQLTRLDREFCEWFEQYLPYLALSLRSAQVPQLRVIPVQSALSPAKPVAPYASVRELVKGQELIAVQECICKKGQGLLGKECSRPHEVCLVFGQFARGSIDHGAGRQISLEECLAILDLAEKNALVLSPSNTQELSFICCCCSCCCPSLRYGKYLPRPQDEVISYFQAKIDPELCSACGDCLDRCQIEAIREGEKFFKVIDGRCIGCGLCVTTCPEQAIVLEPRPGTQPPPKDLYEVWDLMAKARGVV
jgi:NAD-dependent dihydropyrimidine dehydrogenase PreA subunit/DNA-binding HxlR family transcriptional regulator